MLPKTKAGERVHRERKRLREISIIVEEISGILGGAPDPHAGDFRILEFGSGEGSQIRQLQRLGRVIASDIYTSEGIRGMRDIEFVECRITQAPFEDGQFDIIFSNHVIEHIDDITGALREARRIGTASCIYAFSVPTNIWLVLSIPGQYYDKWRGVVRRVRARSTGPSTTGVAGGDDQTRDSGGERVATSRFGKYFGLIMPHGHGATSSFVDCYRNFKIEGWRRLFSDNGFAVIEIKPLLLYGPSNWPVIPILNSRNRICSSVLFLMKKDGEPDPAHR